MVQGPAWVVHMAVFAYFCNLNMARRLVSSICVSSITFNTSYFLRLAIPSPWLAVLLIHRVLCVCSIRVFHLWLKQSEALSHVV